MNTSLSHNHLQTLKAQRSQHLWKKCLPYTLACAALIYFALWPSFHVFLLYPLVSQIKQLCKENAQLLKLNTEIRQEIRQQGFRIEDNYPLNCQS